MNSQRDTAKIIGNKTHLMLLLFSFTSRTLLLLVQILAAMTLFVVCILNMLCSISLVNWTTCKQIAEIEKKVDVMLLRGNDNNNDNHDPQSPNGISLQNGKGGNCKNSCPDGRGRRIEQ
jgi:hypothetical protein